VAFIPVGYSQGQAWAPPARNVGFMPRAKKRKKAKKTGAKRLAEIKRKIEAQRRRAARPTLPVNTQVRISETLSERKRKLERRREQQRDWDDM
jgi:hypothetical protein